MKRYLDDLVLNDLATNGHGNNAAPDNETCHVLFSHPILPPLAGEGANDSLREFHVKLVVLTGPRQVGKTTLARQLMSSFGSAQYLNWDVLQDRAVIQRQSWNPRARLLVMDEIHKMRDWKAWLKGVVDGRSFEQALLVTGSARMETFRQGAIRWPAVILLFACFRFL